MRSDGNRDDDGSGIEPLAPTDPPRIGPYALLGRLGSGGMGRVFLARSEGGRTVAVKVVHEEHTANGEFRARFRREISAARRVGERFTAPVLDADPDAAQPWVATGYVPGPSLEQVVRENGPLPARSVHALADGLLRALRGIHRAGIVHRDLKPSNVLLTVEGPRVIDFGIARALQPSVESLLTGTGRVIGSPGFMAPEQILGEATGPEADVFALGCVLMYAVSGRLPFGRGAKNQHAVMYQIVNSEPQLTGVDDPALRSLIARCLAKDPVDRPGVGVLLTNATGPLGAVAAGQWLPPDVLARLARQAARLLDAEAPTAPATERAAEEAGADAPAAPGSPHPDSGTAPDVAQGPVPESAQGPVPESARGSGTATVGLGAKSTPEPAAVGPDAKSVPDSATVGLGAKSGRGSAAVGPDAEAPGSAAGGADAASASEPDAGGPDGTSAPAGAPGPEQAAPAAPESTDRATSHPADGAGAARPGSRQRRAWLVAGAVAAVLAVAGTLAVLLPGGGDPEARGKDRAASPSGTAAGPSPAPSGSKGKGSDDAAGEDGKDKRKDKGQKDKETGEGTDSGREGGADGDRPDPDRDSPGDTGKTASPSPDGDPPSGGGDSGSDGDDPPSSPSSGNRVPQRFVGVWERGAAQSGPEPARVVVYSAAPGQRAVTMVLDSGTRCEFESRLIAMEDGGKRMSVGPARVVPSGSTGYCVDGAASTFTLDSSGRLYREFSGRVSTHPYTRVG
ncbi:protein kinase [Streptomyces sp. NPDC018031]|uniref:serine/threonine-protein kinase n=1 Tax=Streptomyces sp. NPDC018031 TaxID=3365033 RepID=UPI003792CE6B